MLKLIVLVAFAANLNAVLTDISPSNNASSEKSNYEKCQGPHEYFACDNDCDNVCSLLSIESHANCPRQSYVCTEMCYCEEGYARDSNNICIPISKCPSGCKANEEFLQCPNKVCREKTCHDLGFQLPCYTSKINNTDCGRPGCICKEGFVKNQKGVCILKKECPSCGGDTNATSGCGTFCHRCTGYIPCPEICRLNSCECRSGYVYDDTKKKCVLPSQCPESTCKANEEYSKCPNELCREKTCDELGFKLSCNQADRNTTECGKPSCICKEGYVKNKIGVCIPKKDCPSCGGDSNAISGCGTFCNRCTGNIPCPKICLPNSCDCRSGYVYDLTKKKCVLPSQCPKECKENEEYEECPNRVCREKKCTDLGYPLACYQTDNQNVECGKPDCICQLGFVRNKDGICIPSRECPSCGGDSNAWSGCGVYCTRCSNYKSKNHACILLCRLNSCDCRTGYVYDEIKKKCVLPEQCPCNRNEVRSNCANSPCVIENCTQKGQNNTCTMNPANCKRGCLCAKGYLRSEDGTCIPKDQCPRPCGPYEVYSSCANAGCDKRNCSQVAEPALCIDIFDGGCKGDCVCQPDYLRNAAGECVPISKCPSKEICPKPHEYYDECPSCPERQCGIDDQSQRCEASSSTNECIPSCRCEKGYYRNSMGDCVTFEKCPKCGPLEVYSDCANAGCDKRNCSQLNQPAICIDVIQGACKGDCVCKPDYLRNAAGECVRSLDCPGKEVCPKPHEYFDLCPPSCPARKCGIDDRVILCAPPSPTAGCNKPSCRCEEGYYRNSLEDCVPFEECPPQCGINEVPSECGNNGCLNTCAEPSRIAYCDPNPAYCKPGCVCAEGYLRDENGVCILKNKCPPNNSSCGGDPNAEPGCGSFCTRCSNYKTKNVACALACMENGCECRANYVYDDIVSRKCVLPENCPSQCGVHEVESDCANNACLPTCAQPDLNLYCKPNPANCKSGCVCAEGYLRNQNKVCVAKEKCPSKTEDSCLLPPETGRCRANMPKYYYDSSKNDCYLFTYGGCGGNDNKFDTKSECLEKCSHKTKNN